MVLDFVSVVSVNDLETLESCKPDAAAILENLLARGVFTLAINLDLDVYFFFRMF